MLDGSPKKAKLVAHASGEFEPDSDDPIADAAAVIKEITKDLKLPDDAVGLVIDTGLAAFRSVRLPFSEPAKIEEVIKFEVESQLPQWSIDDVVVDFLTVSSTAVESNLIVTAVPKAELASRLAICSGAGLEPLEVELESSAMVNAAHQAGLFDDESACVLVHFGDSSTSVAVVDGGELRSMRAVHIGAFPPQSANEETPSQETYLKDVVGRLRRELLRAVSGTTTTHPLEAVYVCGHAAPGLVGEDILDVPVEALQLLPDETGTDVEDPGRYFVAWGSALRQLGGGMLKPSLRREEFRFLGKFERLELPLAVLGLLLLTFFSVRGIITYKDIQQRERNIGIWLQASNNFMLGDPKEGKLGKLRDAPPEIREYAKNASAGLVAQTTSFEQLQKIELMLQREILTLQKDLGRDSSIRQPMSAFEGMTLVLGVLHELGDSIGQFSMRRVESNYYSGKGGRDDKVTVKLDLTFRGDGTIQAGNRYKSFLDTLRDKPWYVADKEVKESTLETNDGIYMDGLLITIDPSRAMEEPAQEAS